MKIINAIGDGSCLIHSILLQICDKYKNLDDLQKRDYVRNLRKQITMEVSEQLFNTMSNGNLKEIITYEDWKKIMNSSNPLGEECLEFFTHYFEININIWWKYPFEKYPFRLKFYPNYTDVHIYWTGNHYDAIQW